MAVATERNRRTPDMVQEIGDAVNFASFQLRTLGARHRL
jgi:hypothetical protein